MSASPTLDDLKYDELRQILGYLSVRQLFVCRRVCHKWFDITSELLESQPVFAFNYNDIDHYTNEELSRKCSDGRHLPVNASVGRLMTKTNAFIAAFTTPSFRTIRPKLLNLFDFCPKIQSLDLTQLKVQFTDIEVLFDYCPLLECLAITSEDTNWTKYLSQRILGLKHFSVSFTSKTPIYGVFERPPEEEDYANCKLNQLLIDRPQTNDAIVSVMSTLLRSVAHKLTKFHFTPFDLIDSQAMSLTNALSDNSHNTVLKDFNLNANVSEELLDALTELSNLETLYLHFTTERQLQQTYSLKEMKNLRKLILDFNANRSEFSMEENPPENDSQLNHVLSAIPPKLASLVLYDAVISLSVFSRIGASFPNIVELELTYVRTEKDIEQCFWQIISNLKYLKKLTLNHTDITEEGLEHLMACESLDWLELVKYKGPDAANTFITTQRVMQCFGILAAIRPKHWFELRLDIDICEVNEQMRSEVPKNVRLVNVGYKKFCLFLRITRFLPDKTNRNSRRPEGVYSSVDHQLGDCSDDDLSTTAGLDLKCFV